MPAHRPVHRMRQYRPAAAGAGAAGVTGRCGSQPTGIDAPRASGCLAMDSAAECAATGSVDANNKSGETVMTALAALWLPIVVGAVFVFIASSIIHMGPFWHRNNYPKLPDEEKLRAAVGSLAIPPGDYMVPRCENMADMRTPEFVKKMTEGPVWLLTVRPNGVMGMGKALTLWFLYILVIALFAGYIAGFTHAPGANYLSVFRVVGTAAF